MTPYINPSFRDRQEPVALLTGAVEDPAHVPGPGMSPAFRARGQAFIEAQSREVTPEPTRTPSGGNRHAAFCAILAFPVAFAIMAAAFGDMRSCAILCLVGMAIALIGLYTLDGPA